MGDDDRVLVIAECGVNHNGKIENALRLVKVAAEAGADIVKFQTFTAEALVVNNNSKNQPDSGVETQYVMLKKLQLERAHHLELIDHCNKCRIEFLSTPFDLESIRYLAGLDLSYIKIPSGEITNLPYLRLIGGYGKPIILSTGMADESEIETALDILEASGTQREKITMLHCNTAYPTPMKDVNLRAMIGLREKFRVVVGYSDHTLGIEVPVAAVAMGARVIEKHLTLDRNLPGPDHLSSLMSNEFEQMTKAIRSIEIALGDGVKQVSPSERENRLKVRKSIVASKVIKVGEEYSLGNLATKRPGKGLSPMCWDQVIGRRAERDYQKDELIDPI